MEDPEGTAPPKETGIIQTQDALTNLKNQIRDLDKVGNPKNLYYSLQRNIELFENQLSSQLDNMNKGSLPLISSSVESRKKSLSTRARDQYKSFTRKAYPRRSPKNQDITKTQIFERPDSIKDTPAQRHRNKNKTPQEIERELALLNPLSLYSIPLRPVNKAQMLSRARNVVVTGDLDSQLKNIRLPGGQNDLDTWAIATSPDYKKLPRLEDRDTVSGLGRSKVYPARKYISEKMRRHSGVDEGVFGASVWRQTGTTLKSKKNQGSGVKERRGVKTRNLELPEIPGKERLVRQEERGYERMMDEHALHIFLIRFGKVIEETPEFISFKRICERDWGKILPLIKILEKNSAILGIKLIKVNGGELYKLSFKTKITQRDLLNCFMPNDETDTAFNVLELWAILKENAAVKIQTWVRMKQAQKMVTKIRILIKYVKIIQNFFRLT